MTDVLKQMREAGYQPEEVIDNTGFAPFNGTYLCRIEEAGRLAGIGKSSGEPYDFRTIKLEVVEVLKGDKAVNRRLDMSFNPDEKGVGKLINVLFTAGIEVTASGDDELDTFLPTIKDKTMFVRAWGRAKMRKEGDEWVEVEPKEMKQYCKVIKNVKVESGKPKEVQVKLPF